MQYSINLAFNFVEARALIFFMFKARETVSNETVHV